MTQLTATLVWLALQVTLLSLVTLTLYAVARRFSPLLSKGVLSTGLGLALVLTLLAASPWPRWQLAGRTDPLPSPAPATGSQPASTAAANTPDHLAEAHPVAPAAEIEPITLADYASHLWQALQQPAQPAAPEQREAGWLFWILLVGVGLGVLRLLLGLASVQRLLAHSRAVDEPEVRDLLAQTGQRLGIRRSVEVRESPTLATPATVGWWRPRLLLPRQWREWNPDERQVVVAHELAHVAGRDFAGWLVARLVVALHFYHPLVHWLASRLQLEQELAADATAAELVGNRQRYLHTLAGLALATPHHNLSGPARALIPGRSLLMRRVEMLRAPLRTVGSQLMATRLRWAQFALLALVALGLAGLRAPNIAEAQTAATTQDTSDADVERIPLTVVPVDAICVASVRPAKLIASKPLEPLAARLSAKITPLDDAGLTVEDVAEAMVCVLDGGRGPRVVVRMTTYASCERLQASMIRRHRMAEVEGGPESTIWRSMSLQCYRLDDRTLVFDEIRQVGDLVVAPMSNPAVPWSDHWISRANEQVVVAFNNRQLWETMPLNEKTRIANLSLMPMIMPAVQQVDMAFATASVGDDLTVDGLITTASPEGAEQVKSTLTALMTLGENAIDAQQPRLGELPVETRDTVLKLLEEGKQILTEAKVETDGTRVTLSYVGEGQAAEVAVAASLLLPAVEEARMAARQNVSMNNLKQLALGVHNYYSVYKQLPQAAGTRYYDYNSREWRESEHPHSWRVAILPFLEGHDHLARQYRFDEPWNSEANLKVMEQMPPVFRDPSATGDQYHTTYFALTGPETLFPANKQLGFRHVADGTSNTIMFVEAKRDIPWTKPEDIPYAKEAAVPELGGHYPGKVLVSFADGYVRPLDYPGDLEELRKLITRAGGEVINFQR